MNGQTCDTKRDGHGTLFIWIACEYCGSSRWVRIQNGRLRNRVCRKCISARTRMENSSHWKGGRYLTSYGYVMALAPDHPYQQGGYVQEHRLMMEQILGRYLLPRERVHHRNGIKDDNRLENLQLLASESEHAKIHGLGRQGIAAQKAKRERECLNITA